MPLSLSLADVCKDYVAYKHHQGLPTSPEHPFFTALNGRRCQAVTIYEHFRTVLHKAGISHGGRGAGPRLHDVRHTFCVNALVKLSEAGLDLYCSLPILSTYVGHQSLEATNRYVRLTAEMFPKLLATVNAVYPALFPDLAIAPSSDPSSPHAAAP